MRYIWIFLQVSIVPFVLILLQILRAKIVHENALPFEKGCLVISNHECKLDPYFILAGYGAWKSIRNTPFRFPVLEEYMRKTIIGKIITLFGGFSIGVSLEEKARSLFFIRSLLIKNGSVLIFPEARLVKGEHSFEDFQKGYTHLVTGDVQVILAKLENFHSWSNELFNKKRPTMTFRTIPSTVKKEEALLIIRDFYGF